MAVRETTPENRTDKLLEIQNLTVNYVTDEATVYAVRDLNLTLGYGQTLGIVGETGAGKTTTAKSIMRILPDPPAKVAGGKILFEGKDVLSLREQDMRKIRGNKISMIFQDPMTSLNPVLTVGEQIAEVVQLHQEKNKKEAWDVACEMLELVGIDRGRAKDYPHQFSGGMKQRVVIAIALACNPELLIADEPTTALDVTIQAQVLELMKQLQQKYRTSLIMITHDLGIVAEICNDVAIMYAGRIVEYGSKEQIFLRRAHPYTKGLFNCIPDIYEDENELIPIDGMMADPTVDFAGCAFCDRCAYASERCRTQRPAYHETEPGHLVACFQVEDAAADGKGDSSCEM